MQASTGVRPMTALHSTVRSCLRGNVVQKISYSRLGRSIPIADLSSKRHLSVRQFAGLRTGAVALRLGPLRSLRTCASAAASTTTVTKPIASTGEMPEEIQGQNIRKKFLEFYKAKGGEAARNTRG